MKEGIHIFQVRFTVKKAFTGLDPVDVPAYNYGGQEVQDEARTAKVLFDNSAAN